VLSADKSKLVWQDRPSDPELEAAMLQMLAAKLGEAGGTGAGATAAPTSAADTSASASGNGAAAAPDSPAATPPQLRKQTDGSPYIAMYEPFDKSWRKVGLSLERAKYLVTDKNRLSGIYYIRIDISEKEKSLLDKLKFWNSDEKPKSIRYQVQVREVDSGCEVTAHPTEAYENAEIATQDILENVFKSLQYFTQAFCLAR
jgi:outer membrane protein assembly factor BamC